MDAVMPAAKSCLSHEYVPPPASHVCGAEDAGLSFRTYTKAVRIAVEASDVRSGYACFALCGALRAAVAPLAAQKTLRHVDGAGLCSIGAGRARVAGADVARVAAVDLVERGSGRGVNLDVIEDDI